MCAIMIRAIREESVLSWSICSSEAEGTWFRLEWIWEIYSKLSYEFGGAKQLTGDNLRVLIECDSSFLQTASPDYNLVS